MNNKFFKVLIFSTSITVIILIALGYFFNDFYRNRLNIFDDRIIKKITVRGSSMYPSYKHGQELEADFSYTTNNEQLKKNDAVVVDFMSTYDDNLLKFVKVAPGDTFHVDKEAKTLYVNGEAMKNSQGNSYILSNQNMRMIGLYERDFSGIMPNEIYFIFGDRSMTLDSGRFGPVVRSHILAKVIN